jgi:type II secretory pathway pseudopilin PulG
MKTKKSQVSLSYVIIGAIGIVVLVILIILVSSQMNSTSESHEQRYESLASLQECQELYRRAEAAEKRNDIELIKKMLELESKRCYEYDVGFDWDKEREIIIQDSRYKEPFFIYFNDDGNLILRNPDGDEIILDEWMIK